MLTNYKALVVIVVLAWLVFRFARSICLQYMSAEDFIRRRNVWFALTIVAFLSPNFWLYAIFAMILLYWAAARDANPLALYVMVTFVVPNARFYIPTAVIGQLFDLTQYRILSLVILLPSIVRSWNDRSRSAENGLKAADLFLIAFLLLQVVLQMQYESTTATLRRAFLLFIDTFVVFYAFSRLSSSGRVAETMMSFFIGCAVMAPIGIFEWAKGWQLYTGLSSLWGDPNMFSYLFRGGSLRAQAAADNSIGLGYLLGVSLGFFLFLRSRATNTTMAWAIIATLSMGIYVTGSRGAWVTAALLSMLFVLLRPNAASRVAGTAVLFVMALGIMYMTPLKESVLDRLPGIGTADQDTVEYRKQLAEVSWTLIRQNPFFGDPFVARNMESLRQGQGIIDIVNGYLKTALFSGLVGLSLQLSVFGMAVWGAAKAWLRTRSADSDSGYLGAALVATFLATLFFIATAGIGTETYILAALLTSYGASALGLTSGRHAPIFQTSQSLRGNPTA